MAKCERSLLKNITLDLDPLIVRGIKESSRAVNELGQYATLNMFKTMGVMQKAGDTFKKEELFEELYILPKYRKLYESMVDILIQAGFIETCYDKVIVTEKAEIDDIYQRMLNKRNEIYERYPIAKAYVDLLWVCSQNIAAILTGKETAQNIMFPNASIKLVEGIYKNNKISEYFNQVTTKAVIAYIKAKLELNGPNQKIKILEIGAGTGGTSTQVLREISNYSKNIHYVYTDISKAFIIFAKKTFGNIYSFIDFSLLNIEEDAQNQGYEAEDFDIIIATNVLHATTNIGKALKNINRLLSTNGWLVLSEATRVEIFATLTFGLTDGWWLFEDDEVRLKGSPLLDAKGWERILKKEGFDEVSVLGPATDKNEGYSQHVFLAEKNSNLDTEYKMKYEDIRRYKLLKDALALYGETKINKLGAAEFIHVLEIHSDKSDSIKYLLDDISIYNKKCQFYIWDGLEESAQDFFKKKSIEKIDAVIMFGLPDVFDDLKTFLADLSTMLKHNFIIFIAFPKGQTIDNNPDYQEWKSLLEQYKFKNVYILGDDSGEEKLIMAESDVESVKNMPTLFKQEDHIQLQDSLPNKPLQACNNNDLILDVKKIISEILMVSCSDIEVDEDFNDLGLDSILTSEVTSKLNAIYKINMNPTVFFNCSTIKKLVDEMIQKHSTAIFKYYDNQPKNHISDSKIKQSILDDIHQQDAIKQDVVKKDVNTKVEVDDLNNEIAIIGISGMFPGADNVDEFWDLLLQGKEALSELPIHRWKNTVFEKIDIPNEFISRAGIITRADKFDSEFFKISPMEAKSMDPRQRTLLECSYHAVEDAGYKISDVANSKVGVFIGTENNEYEQYLNRDHPLFLVGASNAMVANRISYQFNFTGASQTVDASCAGGLLAFHDAVKSLQRGEIDYAIVGCSTIIYSPIETVEGLKAQLLSPDGRCRTFDQNANGWVIGETVVCILLKPLAKATLHNDNIYSVVKGIAVNHGGKVSSITAPNPKKQAENVGVALQDAGVGRNTITYVSAHGVGSALIDTAEIEGLKQAYTHHSKSGFCALGSVTPNIGNVNAASGLAGLVQAVMAIKHKKIPPNINISQENKSFDLENSPFYLPTEPKEWDSFDYKTPIPRRAAVNSFGITGVNVHVVLEEYAKDRGISSSTPIKPYIVPLSAKTTDSLREYIFTLIDYFEKHPNILLSDVSHTLQIGREAFSERVVIIAHTLDELKRRLRIFYDNFSSSHHIFYVQPEDKSPEELKRLKKEYSTERLISLSRGDKEEELAALWSKGVDLSWKDLFKSDSSNRISLPGYFFKNEHYPVIPESFKSKEALSKNINVEKTDLLHQELIVKLSAVISTTLELKSEAIDINTNFKEYGINSMTGMFVMKAIQNQILPSFPMTALLEYPTIKSLAEYLLKKYSNEINITDSSDNAPSFIFPIQQGGSKKKSFWVHELFGDVSWLIQLAKSMGEDYPIYGLEAGEIDANDTSYSIEKIAAQYIESMRKIQPDGPYIIGGYSGGGVIAYEMAYQLVKQGLKVDKLIILDTFMPGSSYFDEVKQILFNSMDHHALFLAALASRYENKSESAEGLSYSNLLPIPQDKRIEYVARYLVENTNSTRTFESQIKEVNKNINTSQYLTKCCYEYKVKKFPEAVDLTLIRCKSFIGENTKSGISIKISKYDHGENWQTYIPNPINVYDIDCDHFELVHIPYVNEVSEICSNIIGGKPMITKANMINLKEQTCIDINKDRPYDVGIIGGHGCVGIEAVTYLFNKVSKKLVVGGRNADNAREVLKDHGLPDIQVQQVDIFNDQQLREFCSKCRIVINCAGPSYQVEDRVAKIAAETATNFLDVGIMEVLIDKVGALADTLNKNKCACVYGTGIHPGLDDIFAFYADKKAAALMDEFDSFETYFGDKASWYSEGSLRDIVWAIHQGFMSNYFGYYENGKWRKPGIFSMFTKRYFPDVGKERCTFMFQPLLKPLVSRYKKVFCYGWFDLSIVFSALKIRLFMKGDDAKAVKYLGSCLQKRGEKFPDAKANTYLYAVIKGKKNNRPTTLKVSMVPIEYAGYWSVAIIPAIAAQMMLNKQINFVGAKSLVEIVDPEIFMKVLEESVGIKLRIEHSQS